MPPETSPFQVLGAPLQALGAPARPRDGLVYVSGAWRSAADASISVFDHGLLYGDGVFEGIRAYNRRVFKLARQLHRLLDSANAIRPDSPHTQSNVARLW